MHFFTLAITWDWSNINGFGITTGIVGIIIVFSALVLLSYIYRGLPKLLQVKLRREGKVKKGAQEEVELSGEVNAAISMAIYLFFDEIHDQESGKITIKKVSKRYSPWSAHAAKMNSYFDKRK
jgi:Na+-transporting methylmalonyl-CoA/oxaloacetate decarboxylase gamma subunit